MDNIILYHGSTKEKIVPTYGLGEDRHDYGKGFYLTEDLQLAREWSVSNPMQNQGWVHKYSLDINNLSIYDFSKGNILSWLAELMKHRNASDSKRYHMLSQKFNQQYNSRDSVARENMRHLIDSDKNKVVNVFSTLISIGGV